MAMQVGKTAATTTAKAAVVVVVAVVVVAALLQPCEGGYVLEPGAFLKLPGAQGSYALNNGAATRAAYDAREKFLYVVGYSADLLHIVDMNDTSNPQILSTKTFNYVEYGLPDSISVCRGGINREFLVISYESRRLVEKGHVHFYELLNRNTVTGPLHLVKDHVGMNSYDPRSLAFDKFCTQLVVVSEGQPHEINGVFEDPPADVEVLIPSFGVTVDRKMMPIVESKIASAKMRHVFEVCDTGATTVSNRVQDLEPKKVHVDQNDMAYILFSENNGIGKLDLTDPLAEISYYDLGRKDWSSLGIDTAYEDNGINLVSRKIQSFYQPSSMVSFEVQGKMWLATADTGSIRRYSLRTCKFDESVIARSWRQQFSDGLTAEEISKLQVEMNDYAQLGRVPVSKLKSSNDGWDPIFQGYDFVSTFGGRGFSILDPTDMSRVYDSGDDFERYFTTNNATEAQKAVFNGAVGSNSNVMSSQFDRRSPEMGPMPSAIAATNFSDSQLVIIANGVVGGLYYYSVNPGPAVTFEGFVRRGQPGMTWTEAYARNDDAVGEPYITDMLIVDDQDEKTLVVLSSYAGALSFYNIKQTP